MEQTSEHGNVARRSDSPEFGSPLTHLQQCQLIGTCRIVSRLDYSDLPRHHCLHKVKLVDK